MRRAAAALLLALALGCEGPHLGFPWDFERMIRQARADAYGASRFFADGMAMRTPPAGTVPFRPPGVAAAPSQPPAITLELLQLGRERFDITCAACHGLDGSAGTPVAASMRLRPPPSLHEPRLRALSADALERIVDQGYGLMPSYRPLLDARERQAVVAYVKTLQSSQDVPLSALPEGVRSEAERALAAAAPGGPTP